MVKIMRIVNIDENFRDSLIETLDKGDITGKKRPYYLNLTIYGYSVLVPLRKNCPESPYKVPILNRYSSNHGLDCSKMIIIDRNEFSKKTSPSNIERYITNDIFSKKEIIKTTVVKTINDFLIMKDKMTKGLDLNENERFFPYHPKATLL